MGAQQGKERSSHSSGSHGGTASCIGISSSSPIGSHTHAGHVNALTTAPALRGSRIKSSATPAAVATNIHRSGVGSVTACNTSHTTKDGRCNPIGLNIFTEHNGKQFKQHQFSLLCFSIAIGL